VRTTTSINFGYRSLRSRASYIDPDDSLSMNFIILLINNFSLSHPYFSGEVVVVVVVVVAVVAVVAVFLI
jgi:hypothetical protein